jgi:hypothetical protein
MEKQSECLCTNRLQLIMNDISNSFPRCHSNKYFICDNIIGRSGLGTKVMFAWQCYTVIQLALYLLSSSPSITANNGPRIEVHVYNVDIAPGSEGWQAMRHGLEAEKVWHKE